MDKICVNALKCILDFALLLPPEAARAEDKYLNNSNSKNALKVRLKRLLTLLFVQTPIFLQDL